MESTPKALPLEGEGWVRVSRTTGQGARLRLAPPHPSPLPAGERESRLQTENVSVWRKTGGTDAARHMRSPFRAFGAPSLSPKGRGNKKRAPREAPFSFRY